jgi:hypothetical protein
LSLRLVRDADYQKSLNSEGWAYLCKFLQMDLSEVLTMSGPELLKATYAQIRKNEAAKWQKLGASIPSDGWASTSSSSSSHFANLARKKNVE